MKITLALRRSFVAPPTARHNADVRLLFMATATLERLVYHPPKSAAFGHQARIRDARVAWKATEAFLNEWTVYQLSPQIRLDCYGQQPSTDSTVSLARIEEARKQFGEESNPSSDPRHTKSWPLESERLAEAIAFALDDDKWPRQALGPSNLHFWYSFQWRALPSVPEQPSHLGIFLGNQRAFLQPTLVFPAAYDAPNLRAFLVKLEGALPFRLRNQYFKRWLASQRSKHGIVRKLDKNWRQQPNSALLTDASGSQLRRAHGAAKRGR
jgi:hypothetical protein